MGTFDPNELKERNHRVRIPTFTVIGNSAALHLNSLSSSCMFRLHFQMPEIITLWRYCDYNFKLNTFDHVEQMGHDKYKSNMCTSYARDCGTVVLYVAASYFIVRLIYNLVNI